MTPTANQTLDYSHFDQVPCTDWLCHRCACLRLRSRFSNFRGDPDHTHTSTGFQSISPSGTSYLFIMAHRQRGWVTRSITEWSIWVESLEDAWIVIVERSLSRWWYLVRDCSMPLQRALNSLAPDITSASSLMQRNVASELFCMRF